MTARRIEAVVLTVVQALAWAVPCYAQSGAAAGSGSGGATPTGNSSASSPISIVDDAAKNSSTFNFSYGPPSSPGLDLLGLSNSKLTPSSSLAPFLLSIPATVSGPGGQYAGLDISILSLDSIISPEIARLGRRGETPPPPAAAPSYALDYFLARTRLDFGITNGQSNSDPSKEQLSGIALGVSTSVLPNDNPLQVSRIAKANGERYFSYCLTHVKADELSEQNVLDSQFQSSIRPIISDQTSIQIYLQSGTPTAEGLKQILDGLETRYASYQPKVEAKTVTLDPALGKVQVAGYGTLEGEYIDILKRIDTALDSVEAKSAADATAAAQKDKVPDAIAQCAKGATALAAASADLTFGLGARETGTPGQVRDLGSPGGAGWLSWRVPLGGASVLVNGSALDLNSVENTDQAALDAINGGSLRYALLGGSIHFDENDRFTTGNSKTPVIQANEVDAWLGLQVAWGSWQAGAQGGYSKVAAISSADKIYGQAGARWLVQGNYKIGSTGAWIGVTYGNANGTTAKLNDKTFLVNLYFSPPSALALFGK